MDLDLDLSTTTDLNECARRISLRILSIAHIDYGTIYCSKIVIGEDVLDILINGFENNTNLILYKYIESNKPETVGNLNSNTLILDKSYTNKISVNDTSFTVILPFRYTRNDRIDTLLR